MKVMPFSAHNSSMAIGMSAVYRSSPGGRGGGQINFGVWKKRGGGAEAQKYNVRLRNVRGGGEIDTRGDECPAPN